MRRESCQSVGAEEDAASAAAERDRRVELYPELVSTLKQCLPIVDAYRVGGHPRVSFGDGDIAAMNARYILNKCQEGEKP